MELKNYTYLFWLVISLSIPLVQSFQEKKQYNKKIKYILPAIFIASLFFLVWDIYFTKSGIWNFNLEYTLGIKVFQLPLEEWLFFLVVPYCCIFIYEIVKVDLERFEFPQFFRILSWVLIIGFGIIGFIFRHRAYTFTSFLLPSIFLGFSMLSNRFQKHITKFYFCFFISLIPLLVVYGSLCSLPLVEYNPDHILNIRIINIPVEDFTYYFLMLLMVITIYEKLKESKYY